MAEAIHVRWPGVDSLTFQAFGLLSDFVNLSGSDALAATDYPIEPSQSGLTADEILARGRQVFGLFGYISEEGLKG